MRNIITKAHVGGAANMGPGVKRRVRRDEIELKLSLVTREYILRLNRKLCDGCGVCAENCPKEAIQWTPGRVAEGRLTRKPKIDFAVDSCILCGECATICPLDALKMEIDGEEIATIVKNEAFPILLKDIEILKEKCDSSCESRCEKECPTQAITVQMMNAKGKDVIADPTVDKSLCIFCTRCEWTCPQAAIKVKKPFLGKVDLDYKLCPTGCRACADICPAKAVEIDGSGKPKISSNFCVYCFACEKVCPEKAIKVKREWIFHSEVRSATWLTALKKLTSLETVLKEASRDSAVRRSSLVKGRFSSA